MGRKSYTHLAVSAVSPSFPLFRPLCFLHWILLRRERVTNQVYTGYCNFEQFRNLYLSHHSYENLAALEVSCKYGLFGLWWETLLAPYVLCIEASGNYACETEEIEIQHHGQT